MKGSEPCGRKLTRTILDLAVVVTGTDNHFRFLAETDEVFRDHCYLELVFQKARDVEKIAYDDDVIIEFSRLK